MPVPKKNSVAIKNTDGRKNNGRKAGDTAERNTPLVKATTSQLNKAKKDRIGIYALNAMNKVFGSEEDAWESLAEQAKTSFAHLNLLWQYKYGKPIERTTSNNNNKQITPVINFYNTAPQLENTIDVTEDDYEDEETDE